MSSVPAGQAASRERYRLGDDLCLDAGCLRLERNGTEIALPKLSFDLLLALVRAAPNVVTYDELMAQVWPGLIVQSETISQRVKLLRDALGDDSHAPRVVRGVRGRGYALACAVQPSTREEAPFPSSTETELVRTPAPASASARSPFGARVAMTIGALLAVAIAIAILALPQHADTPKAIPGTGLAVGGFGSASSDPGDIRLARSIGEAVYARLSGRSDLALGAGTAAQEKAVGGDRGIGENRPSRESGYVLQATVQRNDARLRVTAHVVELQGGALVHSFIAERDARDVLELEDDIAQRAARALRVEREARAALRHPDPGTRSAEARLAFERGRARFQRWRADDGDAAVAHFRRSIALDPTYARAYAWQALADYRDAVAYKRESRQTAWERVLPLFEHALAIDPNLGEAHAMRAFFDFTRDHDVTDAELRRGIAQSPDSAESYALLAQRLASSDIPAEREREALDAVDKAIALAPDTTRYRYLKALILWRHPELHPRAIELMRSVLESDPDFAPAAAKLGQWTWQELLQPADGARWSEHALRIDPDTPWIRESLCRIYLDIEDAAAARDVVASAVPAASSECRTDLAFAAGDWRRAAQIAFNLPGEALFGDRYGAGWMGSLARYARETGDSKRVLELLQTLGDDQKLVASAPSGFVEPTFLLVQLHQIRGERAAADRLLDALWQWLPEFERMHSTYDERYPIRAMLLAWSGREDEALNELLRWTRRRHSPYWWYVFEHDATWQRFREDPRFIEAQRHERDYAAGQRAMLDTLRRQGAVPMRGKEEAARGVARTANR